MKNNKHIKSFNIFNENKNNLVKKTIMNLFICEYGSTFWKESVSIYESLTFPTSIEISKGHHLGLSFQILLDIDLEKSKELSYDIISKFPQEPLIVISEVNVEMKDDPIGYWFDNDLIEPGRYFDKLVKEGKKGLFVYGKY